jgi:hypothetical protein
LCPSLPKGMFSVYQRRIDHPYLTLTAVPFSRAT